ncbi:YigZ family protein [Helicobacter kayseriensis]|uniref:YigZ family protein n=1 Tax=Helicobacter kayseriensis TaxID=2905877 RepID=UPI001E39874A|nr:YigZ family protein [Helicobacter kayseriensis]MCE3046619.1 YigZ family protein [Helicobacter kayseriensis]MCE3048079.1 YigZ family protein [Helicobacter kayseriensis]
MQTVSCIHEGFFENKGSKFFSFLFPFSEFDSLLSQLREKHPKAVHFVYATRMKELQVIESFSDDGEPRGSSGVPTLNVLRGEGLVNIGLITVRYFGGTLLGVGGLVRAYTQSAQSAILAAKNQNDLIKYEETLPYKMQIPYSLFSQVLYQIEQLRIEILDKCFQAEVIEISLRSTEEKKNELHKICSAKFGF